MALAISGGNLHKYISELVPSGLSWSPIKVHLQERLSKCSSVTMAKHKLTQLKQSELLMHEYIAKFGDMAEHGYSIMATDSASAIVASNFIEGVQNLHIKNKLRSCQVKNLRHIWSCYSGGPKTKDQGTGLWGSPPLRDHNHNQLLHQCHQGQRLFQVWQQSPFCQRLSTEPTRQQGTDRPFHRP